MSSNSALDSMRDRHNTDNSRGRGRGSYINYYGDLGFSTTEDAYGAWKQEEDLYQQQKAEDLAIIEKNKELIAQAQKEYDSYQFNAPDVNQAVEEAYWQSTDDLLKVKVVDINMPSTSTSHYGDTGEEPPPATQQKVGDWGVILEDPSWYTVEATYYVPREAIGKLEGINTFEDTSGSLLIGNTASGSSIGQEIHDALRTAQDEYASLWKDAASAEFNSQLSSQQAAFDSSKQSALDQLNSAKAETQAAEEHIANIDILREEQLNSLRSDYQSRLDTMKEIFGG